MRAPAAALALTGVLLSFEAFLHGAARLGRPLTFDVGPSTGAYGSGFTESEERPPSTFRWTVSRSSLVLPLELEGKAARIVLRAARFKDTPARIHVAVAGRPAGSFVARPGGYRVHAVELGPVRGSASFDLLADDPELGVALDWVRVEGARVRVPLRLWPPRALVVGLYLIVALLGFAPRASALVAGGLGLGLACWAGWDPFGMAHVTERIAVPGLVLTLLAALALRRVPRGRVAVLLFLAGYLLKGAALFHPSYFYNDVRNNQRYVLALRADGRSLLERNHEAQVRVGVAYPRMVGNRKYAFPYSPLFFLPFTSLPPERIVESIKHVALAAAAAEVVVVFLLSGLVFGPGAGVYAALVAVILPPLHSRLLLAMWSTVTGHFLDLLAIGAMVLLARSFAPRGSESRASLIEAGGPSRPPAPPRAGWAAFYAFLQAALLVYVSSLFNLTLFVGAYAALERRRAAHVLALWAAAVAVTVGLLYRDFALLFFREILPAAMAGGGGEGGARMGLGESVATALARIPLFYGAALPVLAGAGFVLARRRAAPPVVRVLAAYALAFAGLVALRAFSLGLFKDLKEVEFVGPLVALLSGASLDALAERDRRAAALVAAGLVLFGLARYREYWLTYTFLAGLP